MVNRFKIYDQTTMSTKHCVLLLVVLQQMIACTSTKTERFCPQPKVGKCICKWIGPYCDVICRGLETMPERLPVNTLYLEITNGTIKEIPEDLLLPLNNLQALQIEFNHISKRFRLPKSISSLKLRNNMLNVSSLYGMFDGLTKLRYLDLSFNPLNGILLPGTFSSLVNLNSLKLKQCQLKDIKQGTFAGLIQLHELDMKENQLQVLRKGSLKGIRSPKQMPLILNIIANNISHIEDGTFEEVKEIGKLELRRNALTALPDLRGLSKRNSVLLFDTNNITDVSSLTKSGIQTITKLSLYRNSITVLPRNLFKDIKILQTLILGKNKIKELPPGFLAYSTTLNELGIENNQIDKIHKDSFRNLQDLRGLYLFNNRISELPDGVFANLRLQNLFLNGNRLKNLTGRPFKGMVKTSTAIFMFANDIEYINDDFLNDLGKDTTLAVRCGSLKDLPHIQKSSLAKITCAPYNIGWIKRLKGDAATSLAFSGFFCKKIFNDNWKCIPCKAGSFNIDTEVGPQPCIECSAGGFYQDEMGKTECKECSTGTYVHPNNTPGTTPLACKACPQGTQTSEKAGYRACKCLPDFYRFDRFGRCFPCPSKAWKCENDYASLSAGFYWKWQNKTLEKRYSKFISNLMIEGRDFSQGTWKYDGTLPSPHKCPRDSCLGGLNSSCQNGYYGPLCALCEQQYYNRMNRCTRCPSRLWAGFQIAIVVVLFIIVLLALLWGDRKTLDKENGRTIADKILSCFKIVIGFYQVMAGVYSAFSDITWPSSVIWMQKTLQFIQLNILQIAPLSCITPSLSFNVLQQFVIVVALNFIIVALILIYLGIRIAVLRRRRSESQIQIDETKSSCIRNICVFLFATYPKTCTSIIQVVSVNCVQLCFDGEHAHCDSYLRSDLSVQCDTPEHSIYSRVATAYLVYPIGFPLVIALLVWKYIYKPSQRSSTQNGSIYEDNDMSEMAGENRVNSYAFRFTPRPGNSPFESGLSLFSENYKSNCWYWETLEMFRKLVLVSGLTLIGQHSRTQVGLGAIISAVFAILYVYRCPIRNKFENLLQTVALMAIFLNLGIGVMLKTSDDPITPVVNKHNDDLGVSILLIIINVAVIGIVTVAVVKAIIMQIRKCCKSTNGRRCSCSECCKACLKCCLVPFEMRSGNFMYDDDSRGEILEHARNG